MEFKMIPEWVGSKGFPCLEFPGRPDHDFFYAFAEKLEKDLGVVFHHKLNDFDSQYWDFNYRGSVLTLGYSVFLGISIYPTKAKLFDDLDERALKELWIRLHGSGRE